MEAGEPLTPSPLAVVYNLGAPSNVENCVFRFQCDTTDDLPDESDDCSSAMDELQIKRRALESFPPSLTLGPPLFAGFDGSPGALDSEPEGQFMCKQCDKVFSKQSSLARHKFEHSGR